MLHVTRHHVCACVKKPMFSWRGRRQKNKSPSVGSAGEPNGMASSDCENISRTDRLEQIAIYIIIINCLCQIKVVGWYQERNKPSHQHEILNCQSYSTSERNTGPNKRN